MNKTCYKSAAFLSDPDMGTCVCWAVSPGSLTSLMPPLLPSTSTCSPPLPYFSFLLHPGYRAWNQTSIQTKQQEKPITQTRLVWAWGRDGGRDLVCLLGQFHFTVMVEEASQDTSTHTSVWLLEGGNQVSPQSTLAHHLLTQYAAGWSRRPVAFT